MQSNEALVWIVFVSLVVFMMVLDMGIINKSGHAISLKRALYTSAMWVGVALIFNLVVFFTMGSELAMQFLAGYLIEESLSVDNLFVIIIIFSFFKVKAEYQHRVLFWGILGAIIFRGIFIVSGVAIIEKFHWTIYVLGAFLVYTGIKLAFKGDDDHVDIENNFALKFFRKYMPITKDYHGHNFTIRENGRIFATPLLLVLIVIETTDIVFAVDSIPAILAISKSTLIIYTSNILAVLGLRSLYFALAGIMGYFVYLNYGLAVVLAFVGVKMLTESFFHISIGYALGFVAFALTTSIILSMLFPKKNNKKSET